MRKITTEEKIQFLDAVSQELFKKDFRRLPINLKSTVFLNLTVRKGEADKEGRFVYDEVMAYAKKIKG